MTDSTTRTEGEMGSSTDDSFAWTEPEATTTTGAGQQAREWLTQLQAMIENLATQAAPVVREVGAKAAELAAMAGDKAGPIAQRAAVFTEQAGHKIAEKGRDLATDLRRDAAAAKAVASETADDAADVAEAVVDTADDAADVAEEVVDTAEDRMSSGVA